MRGIGSEPRLRSIDVSSGVRSPIQQALDFFAATAVALSKAKDVPSPASILARLEGVPTDIPSRPAQAPKPGKLSIAIVCREYPPETAFGGMATFTYHLSRGLADAGHRVAVVTGGRPGYRRDHDGSVDVMQVEPRMEGARDSFEDLYRRGWLQYAPTLFLHGLGAVRAIAELEAVHGPFDVIDLADHAADGLAPALFCGRPSTVRLYSPWALLAAMGLDLSSGSEHWLPVLESALLHRAGAISSPSEDLAARTQTFFDLRAACLPVPNPIDTEQFRPMRSSDDRPRVCFVGRLEERKGIRTLFDAIPLVLHRAPDVEFLIVGPDSQGFRDTLSTSAAERVRFVDRVPLADLPAVYQQSWLAVVPSDYDNSPYTCLEPMACGIPVVGTSSGGIAEYVRDGETGMIVAPRDPEALAEAVLCLICDTETRTRLGDAARVHVERTFDLHVTANLMEHVYSNALEGQMPVAGTAPPVRPNLNVLRPELNRVDVIVLAGIEDGDLAAQTVEASQRAGGQVVVVWDGPVPVGFPGARTTGTSGHAGRDAARLLPALLADCFIVLRAGDVLTAELVDRGRRELAASGDVAVTVDGIRMLCTSAARGLRLADARSWGGVLDRVAARAVK